MFNIYKKSIKWGNEVFSLETGKVARQADGSVLAKYGNTIVLCNVVYNKNQGEQKSFFPLTVNYIEKTFAVGRIPSGFFKREGKPSEKEILTSRLIDRAIRPLFEENFYNEVQVTCTLLSHDKQNDGDIVALIGTIAALALSGLPIITIMAGCRVGYANGQYMLNPTYSDLISAELDLIVAGSSDSIFMVESEAKELDENIMLAALEFALTSYQPIIEMIKELAGEAAEEKFEYVPADYSNIYNQIKEEYTKKILDSYAIRSKQERYSALTTLKSEIVEKISNEQVPAIAVTSSLNKLEYDLVRSQLLTTGKRIDGRSSTDIRDIVIEVDFLPKECVHGSALFTRGETQAIGAVTLGTSNDEQNAEAIEDATKKETFLLHYNFPPYSVGELAPIKGPGRREIGHGKLAYKAIKSLLPSKDDFPYTIRVVTEITESHGSSSMATVCASSLALMATGVPLNKTVAGIAMGLIKEGDNYQILTDISGDEDHLGDMDFKVAGTRDGVTALQMDIKISGINIDIMKKALEQAKEARFKIIDIMEQTINKPANLSSSAPIFMEMKIKVDDIAKVIGKGGQTIKSIIADSNNSKISIEENGTIKIFASKEEDCTKAIQLINNIIHDMAGSGKAMIDTSKLVVGHVYTGVVDSIKPFGAIINLPDNVQGMVHISEIKKERVERVEDHLSIGQKVEVVVIEVSPDRVRLSIKRVGSDVSTFPPARSGSTGRNDRRNDRRGGDRGDRRNKSGGNYDNYYDQERHNTMGRGYYGNNSFKENNRYSQDNEPGSFSSLAHQINSDHND